MKCYAVENHPNDSRCRIDPDGIVQCLSSRMGTGGNNTPFVLITSSKADLQNGSHAMSQPSEQATDPSKAEAKDFSCFAIDSHSMDSRIRIMDGPCPSITAKLAKLTSDGPPVLIKEKA